MLKPDFKFNYDSANKFGNHGLMLLGHEATDSLVLSSINWLAGDNAYKVVFYNEDFQNRYFAFLSNRWDGDSEILLPTQVEPVSVGYLGMGALVETVWREDDD